jgi:leader peptidase (prepilin peptidase)/N-methyltransferase
MTLTVKELLLDNRPFLGAVAFLLGAIIGSFINVVSYRLPRMMERSWRSQCHEFLDIPPATEDGPFSSFNLAFPPSHCPHCRHSIRWWENIPVISYLWLKGKCSECHKPISIRYPAVELITAVMSGIVAWQQGPTAGLLALLLLTWVLVTVTLIDYDKHLLPDDITLPLLWLGLVLNLFHLFTSLHDAVIGAIAGYLILWSTYWGFRLLARKEGMGYGDFKLLAALGAWFGWQALPCIILLSSATGALIGSAVLFAKKQGRQTPIPFGPFLAFAGWAYALWGDPLARTFDQLLLRL